MSPRYQDILDRPMISLTKTDHLTFRQMSGTLVIGDPGSGKSTALGKSFFYAFVRAGCGALADHSTDVRANASYLRKRLTGYYCEEGRDDLVIIQLLRGRQYRVSCTYNPRAAAVKAYLTCLEYLNDVNFFPTTSSRMYQFLLESIEVYPNYAPSRSLHAQLSLFHVLFRNDHQPSEYIQFAFSEAAKALDLDPFLWRAHAALGACYLCTRQWALAKECFDVALGLSRTSTEEDVWYMIFAVAIGRHDEVFKTLERKISDATHTSCWWFIYGLVLYALRRYKESGDRFFIAHISNPFAYFPRAMMGCFQLASEGDGSTGRILLEQLAELDGCSFFFKMPFRGVFMLFLAASEPCEASREKLNSEFKHLLDARAEKSANRALAWDFALAHMALGEHENALTELEAAFDDYHPLAMWMHLWPLLDPLRNSARFKELIRRMELPSAIQDMA